MSMIVGVLSGTSADGIDVGVAEIVESDDGRHQSIKLKAFETVPYTKEERELIFKLFDGTTNLQLVCQANFLLGQSFGNAVVKVLENANIPREKILIVASHGQTVWHDVDQSTKKVSSTLQIGEAAVIAEITGITTIANFRVADVAAGGQGAPLTSIFDYSLLRAEAGKGWRAIQNIGGIGNVTFIPDLSSSKEPIAFDTGPGNVLIDWYAETITNGKLHYDKDGELSKAGKINTAFLSKMLTNPYFAHHPPKTTGRELFNKKLAEDWISQALVIGLSQHDIMATLTELTAISIADSYKDFAPEGIDKICEVIVGGGGSRNSFLMSRLVENLRTHNREIKVLIHEDVGINSDAKESLVFAWLGWMCISGKASSCLKACTGANKNKILGSIFPGDNFHSVMCKVPNK